MPNPPVNVSLRIVHLSSGAPLAGLHPRRARNIFLMEEQEEAESREEEEEDENAEKAEDGGLAHTANDTYSSVDDARGQTATDSYWPPSTENPAPTEEEEEEFVNAVVPEYEDSNEPGSAMGLPLSPEASVAPTRLPPVLLELRWQPPRPPTTFDGFSIYIYRDGTPLP